MADGEEIKPSVDFSNLSVSKIIFFLKSCFLDRDFENVERILSAREEKSKLQIKKLEAKFYKLEEERLERLGLGDDVKKCKRELEESRSGVLKLRAENMVLKERAKFAEDQCKRLSDEMESLREKAHENIELRSKICDLERAKAKTETELEIERLKFAELENRVLKIESGFTMSIEKDDPKKNNEIGGEIEKLENGLSPNAPTDSPVKTNGHSPNAESRGLPSQNIIEIVDSDDDCAPVENDLLQDSSGSSEDSGHEISGSVEQQHQRSTSLLIRGNSGSDGSVPKRRGESRARSPSRTVSGKKTIYFVRDSLLGDHGLSGFFRPQMRNELDGFYPNWVNVPSENKNRIFELFLKEWSVEGYDQNYVYNKFMQQNGEKYRKFLSDLKRSQMKLHKCNNVIELLEKSKPAFMKSQEVWEQYVRHWNSPEQKIRSFINKKNRAAREGSSHGYGRKSVATRLHEQMEQGKTPSLLAVMMDVNKKRDKKNIPTGEFHHRELQTAIDEYRQKHKAMVGPDSNPEEEELNIELWKSTGEVARRMSQGRVLGMGSKTQATSIFHPTRSSKSDSSVPNVEIQSQLEELRCKQEEAEKKYAEKKYADGVEARRRIEAQIEVMIQTMRTLVPGFVMPPMFTSAGASSHASQTQGVCPSVSPTPDVEAQTQGVSTTQPDPDPPQE